jgi:acetyltransferase-like isoleucine patch superfamily enzyme
MKIKYLYNERGTDLIFKKNIKLLGLAKIINSSLVSNIFLASGGCVNRCDLGRYVGLGHFSYIADTTVGNYCTFGSRVSIGAFSHPTGFLTLHEVGYRDVSKIYGATVYKDDPESYSELRSNEKTTIGNDVWVGDNAVVIKGVTIEDGAVIGAGSIVTKDVKAFSIVVGNPAKLIRKRFSKKIIDQIKMSAWWDLSIEELSGIPFEDISLALKFLKSRIV